MTGTISGWCSPGLIAISTGINGRNMKSQYIGILIMTLLLAACGGSVTTTDPLVNAPKVIIDSDFNTMGDDGQWFAMHTQLLGPGKVMRLGLTVVPGNPWLLPGLSDAT